MMDEQLVPEERFKLLVAFVGEVAIDNSVRAVDYYKSGLNMYKEFNRHYREGSWENALSIYLKYEKLFSDQIKKHPDYGKVPVNIKSVNAVHFKIIKPKAEHAKKELLKQYQIDYDSFVEEYEAIIEDIENEYESLSVTSSVKNRQVYSSMSKSQVSSNYTRNTNDHLKLIKQAKNQQKPTKVGSNKSITKSKTPSNNYTGGYSGSTNNSTRVSQKLS